MSAVKNTAPAEAQPASVIIAAARELAPSLERLLAGINAVLDRAQPAAPAELAAKDLEEVLGVPAPAAPAQARPCHPYDRTDNRLRAYVASIRPLRGCVWRDDIEEANQRGRGLVERLALSAEDTGLPKLRLTASEVADVLSFIHCSETIDPENWWREPDDEPSHVVGLNLLLSALEASLREPGKRGEAEIAGVEEIPEALQDFLQEQQTRVAELLSLLERLDEDADQMYTRIAVREAKELERALDSMTLAKVLKGEGGAS